MSSGDARCSQSAVSFNAVKGWGRQLHKATERLQEDVEHLTPEILISNCSCVQ